MINLFFKKLFSFLKNLRESHHFIILNLLDFDIGGMAELVDATDLNILSPIKET